jgi:hypothetical protein
MSMSVRHNHEFNNNAWNSLYFVSDTNKNEGITRTVCERVAFDRQTRNYVLVRVRGYSLVEAAAEWASHEQVFIQVIHACTRSTTFLRLCSF